MSSEFGLRGLVRGSSLALLRGPRVDLALKLLDDVALIREVGDKERSLQEVRQLLQKHLANLKSARVKERLDFKRVFMPLSGFCHSFSSAL